MFELQILVPVADNDGDEFPEAAHALFEEVVVARFGGITRYPGVARGTWTDAGETFHDRNRVYGIAVRSITDGELVRDVVKFAKAHYRQQAIFIRYLGVAEIL